MPATNGHTQNDISSKEPLPIVIAGGGCVGLFLALLLCQSDIPNQVIVIEPHAPNPTDTKAMAHQPLIFPLFASAGLMPELSALGSFSSGLCFRASVANGSKLIAGKKFKEGEKAQLLLPQYKFQELLLGEVQGSGKGDVRSGWGVVGFKEGKESVGVRIQRAADGDGEGGSSDAEKTEEELIEAEYLIGADGAHSTIRRLASLAFDGITLPTQLVATDIQLAAPIFHDAGFYDANFVIDPNDYGLIGRIDTKGLWRVSYGVSANTSDDEIYAGAHEKLAKMLPGGGLNEEGKRLYEVKRIAPYKAQQRCVETLWRDGGRIGIVGDAAHLTNPYAGLGLASGFTDAGSLAPVLVRILTHQSSSPKTLLQSWASARKEQFLNVVDKPSRAAYARVKTRVETEEDVEALLAKDHLVGALKKGMPMMPPSLVTKCDELEGW